MIDKIEEFDRKYRGTYVRFKFPEGIRPVQIEFADHGSSTIAIEDSEYGTIAKKYPACLNDMDLDPPVAGLFNYNEHALHLFRMPARQWQKGFCPANHEIYNPLRKIFAESTYRPQFGRSLVLAVYGGHFETDIPKLIERLTGRLALKSAAITRNLMLSKSPLEGKEYPMVWYKTIPVGFVVGTKFVVEDDMYQQEVKDELTRIGLGQWSS